MAPARLRARHKAPGGAGNTRACIVILSLQHITLLYVPAWRNVDSVAISLRAVVLSIICQA